MAFGPRSAISEKMQCMPTPLPLDKSMNDDPVQFQRETIKIEGGRNLYKYTFQVIGDEGEAEKSEGNLTQEPPENIE